MHLSKFDRINGVLDEEQVENWVAEYFHSLLNIFNAFFCKLEVEEAVSRMSAIPFEKLVLEQLADEDEEVRELARCEIRQLAEIELEFMRAYL
ncbi:MAG: hypothetical protein PHP26_03230 [Syntrophomonas sp.]|uniref:hypothetical protein n=1 Tax=Syntrophomonas sp. TaxID=2053627 RepID=UPI002608F563|nr:hypothetical protein [Syntrophomonas sp.]MDD3878986.1 hypothetical protein [Syntrophomonas sp.]MDD4627043.1 hypothetical protein [Syntrophomonas sp.]